MLKLTAWSLALIVLLVSAAEFWARERFPDNTPWPSPQALWLPADLVEEHPTLDFQLKPNASVFFSGPNDEFDVNYQINEFGLRDSGMFSTGPKRPVVLVLGDSFTEGYGVMRDATFTLELQRQLRFQRGASIYPRILNAGTSGYGAAQSAARGQTLIESLKPKLVIFAYTGLMPVADYRHKQGGTKPITTDKALLDNKGGSALKLVQLFKDYFRASESQAAITIGDPATDLFAAARSISAASTLHRESLEHVVSLAKFAEHQDAAFLLLHLPLPHQVAPDEWQTGRVAHRIASQIYDPPENDLLEELCAAAIPDCLLTTQHFRKLANERSSRLYFPTSYAFTEVGHAAIVELLIDRVRTVLGIATPE